VISIRVMCVRQICCVSASCTFCRVIWTMSDGSGTPTVYDPVPMPGVLLVCLNLFIAFPYIQQLTACRGCQQHCLRKWKFDWSRKQPVRMTLLGNTYITYVLPTTGMHLKVLLRLHHCIASCYPLYGCECRLWLSSYSNWYLFSFRRVLIVHHEILLHKLYNFCGVDHCGTCFISSCVLVLDKFYTESQTTYILSRWRWMVLWMNFYVSWHSIMAKWLHVNVCW